jgi:hypothetical protein
MRKRRRYADAVLAGNDARVMVFHHQTRQKSTAILDAAALATRPHV